MTDLLDRLPRFATGEPGAYRPGFDRIHALLDLFGRPDRSFNVVLVGGTNGKGSTAAMLSALLTAGGRTAGLHTSPHLLDVTERMRVDGRPAARTWLDDTVERYEQEILKIGASFYEATLALSLLYFAQQHVRSAVIEIGLGGRLDAANALRADVCVITTVGMDHTDILGDSIEKIAAEKAGIIRKGTPVVLGRITEPARRVILDRAAAVGAPVRSIDDRHDVLPDIGLAGTHQMENARTAIEAYEALTGESCPETVAARGLSEVVRLSGIRGRMERIDARSDVWVDVAHNVDALAAALITFRSFTPTAERRVVVFGVMRDKDVAGMGRLLARDDFDVVVSGIPGSRALSVDTAIEILASSGVRILDSDTDAGRALDRALDCVSEHVSQHVSEHDALHGAPILVTGSHYLVAEILKPRTSSIT